MADPIPAEYAGAVVPYLIVPDAMEALAFYAKAFGAVQTMLLHGPGGSVMHAEMCIGRGPFMLAGPFPDMGYHAASHYGGTPITLAVYVPDVDALVAQAVAAGCTLLRPVEDQFYGDRSATVTDPFGMRWMLATHIEDVSPAEMQARLDRMFAPG